MQYSSHLAERWLRARHQFRILPVYFLVVTFFAAWLIASHVMADDWSAYQHDNQHAGYSTSRLDPTQLHLAWTAPANFKHPIIVGDRIYAMTQANSGLAQIAEFDSGTGAVIWKYTDMHPPFSGSLAYANGMIIYSGEDSIGGTRILSLHALDASMGNLLYSTPVLANATSQVPVAEPDLNANSVHAYVLSDKLRAFGMDANSGSLVWASSPIDGSAMPTVVGDSLIVSSPGQFYAVSRSNGSVNHFNSSGLNGGSPTSTVYDSVRHQFYVLADDGSGDAINAYQYIDNSHIVHLWRYSEQNITSNNGLALDSNGNIYTIRSALVQISPSGVLLNTFTNPAGMTPVSGIAPIVSDHYVWISESGGVSQGNTMVYDINTLALVATLPTGHFGGNPLYYEGIGMVSDSIFISDQIASAGVGFSVYTVPEPLSSSMSLAGFAIVLAKRRR